MDLRHLYQQGQGMNQSCKQDAHSTVAWHDNKTAERICAVDECVLVKSSQNKSDRLTRVPQRWLDAIKRNTGPVQPACTASVSSVGLDQIKIVHWQSGHPGVRRTLYFVKQIAPGVAKATVKTIVRECEECQSIDLAPVHWSKEALNVKQTWHRVAMDITSCNGVHFLTVIDCGPAQFAIWRRLPRQDVTSEINQLKVLFYEQIMTLPFRVACLKPS